MDSTTSREDPVPSETREPEAKKDGSRKFSVIRFEKRVTAAFSILAKLFTISVIIVATIFIFRELTNNSYSIQQINVPASFEDSGLSGVVVANLISDKLIEIFEVLRSQEEAAQYIKSSDQVDVEVEMVGLGVPIRSFISLIGDALGFHRSRKINGDIFLTNGKAILILRITGQQAESFEIEFVNNDLKTASRVLVEEASKTILNYTNPIALELYYSNIKHDGPNTVRMAKYLMENFPKDAEMVRHAYDSWAWGLTYEEKYEEAEQKIKEGLEKYPDDERLYNAWGNVLSAMGKDEEAITKYQKVFSVRKKEGLSEKRKATMYNNIGSSYALMGNMDSAMHYLQKALAIDNNDWILYYNLGGLYLLKKDTATFYEYFEKSLQKGADPVMIKKDKDLKDMMGDRRVADLLKKYSE